MKSNAPKHDRRGINGIVRLWGQGLRLRGSNNLKAPVRRSRLFETDRLQASLPVVAIAVALILFLVPDARAQPQDWLSYYPSVSRLQGRLTKIFKYGKPTYGENPEKDEKVEVPVLILQTPVRVRARTSSSVNNESLTNVSFVQLIFPPEVGANYAKYLDKDIVVAGTLVRGHTGDHFTDLVMTVKAVNPTGKPM
jgi:uncharacterized protein DUF4431